MVLLEEVLIQLRAWQSSANVIEKADNCKETSSISSIFDNPIIVMLRLLFSIECVPLKSSEMRSIIAEIDKCLVSLQNNCPDGCTKYFYFL